MAVLVPALLACGTDRDRLDAGLGVIDVENVRATLTALAHDSMMGRRTGTAGAERAARFIASEMAALGLAPGGDEGYYQTVQLARVVADGRERLVPRFGAGALDSVPPERRVLDANVIGVIAGGDPRIGHEAVVVGAHYDHVGVGPTVDGDSVYNGADDNASGVVALLEIARAMDAGARPRRTIVFVAFTGEELGALGSYYYVTEPPVPLENTVAQLQIEMIGRPDRLTRGNRLNRLDRGRGRAWLTGYERSTLGDMLRAHGLAVVPDPRPGQNFFERSDNFVFALQGVPAHTLSSFDLHPDYHRPSDEVDRIDFRHMTRVIRTAARAVRILADGPAPSWNPGGRPEYPG